MYSGGKSTIEMCEFAESFVVGSLLDGGGAIYQVPKAVMNLTRSYLHHNNGTSFVSSGRQLVRWVVVDQSSPTGSFTLVSVSLQTATLVSRGSAHSSAFGAMIFSGSQSNLTIDNSTFTDGYGRYLFFTFLISAQNNGGILAALGANISVTRSRIENSYAGNY